jgi:hypothetical protein
MKTKLGLLGIVLIFCAVAVLSGQVRQAAAIGPTTNNSTIPNLTSGDQPQDEIKPPVNSILLGPTSQLGTAQPKVIIDFIGASKQDKLRVTANETWYLQIDVNSPGWLYIYEYSPAGNTLPGKWLAYKWQVAQSGLWELGPFTPGTNEPEGQHIYRVWFYSDGRWAPEDSATSQNNIIYWTYSKGLATALPPQPPVAPVKEATFLDRLHSFVINPVTFIIAFLVLIFLVGFYFSRKYGWRMKTGDIVARLDNIELREQSVDVCLTPASAKLSLPNGTEIPLAGNCRIVGRGDLARALGLNELDLISRQHFQIKAEGEQFYIEDLGSANGTRLNGTDIRGKGSVTLDDNDIIELAGSAHLTFYFL